MRPAVCKGGYPMPLTVTGKVDIVQVIATINDMTADSRLVLIDDEGLEENATFGRPLKKSDRDSYDFRIIDIKGLASVTDGTLDPKLKEPIRIRKGISVLDADNLVPGSIMVYIR